MCCSLGFELRMRFEGDEVPLPVAEGRIIGHPYLPDGLTDAVMDAYEDPESWDGVLRQIFSPVLNRSGFRKDKNADSFFPFGRLRIDLTTFLEQPVLLIRRTNEALGSAVPQRTYDVTYYCQSAVSIASETCSGSASPAGASTESAILKVL